MRKLRFVEIVSMLKQNALLGIGAALIIAVIVLCAYWLYRKERPSTQRIGRKNALVTVLLLCYVCAVVALTLWNRHSNVEGAINLALFSSYKEAWYAFSTRDFQYIYFNIAMFIPLGILLPLLHTRFRHIGWTLATAFVFTALIESMQYILHVGIFELDDIMNNVFGALIGFGLVIACLTRKWSMRLLAITPLCVLLVGSIGMYVYYVQKPFGNLAITAIKAIDMKHVHVTTTQTFSEEQPVGTMYSAPQLTAKEARQYADKLFAYAAGIQPDELEVIAYQREAYYTYQGDPAYSIAMNYVDSTYTLNDFSNLEVKRADTNEATLRSKVKQLHIHIPKKAQFKRLNEGTYEWQVYQIETDDTLVDGKLKVVYYADETIKDVDNHIVTYKKVADVLLKSEQQAYEQLCDGEFQTDVTPQRSIQIDHVKQSYTLDSKGFYQPVYVFTGKVDGEQTKITIPAVQ